MTHASRTAFALFVLGALTLTASVVAAQTPDEQNPPEKAAADTAGTTVGESAETPATVPAQTADGVIGLGKDVQDLFGAPPTQVPSVPTEAEPPKAKTPLDSLNERWQGMQDKVGFETLNAFVEQYNALLGRKAALESDYRTFNEKKQRWEQLKALENPTPDQVRVRDELLAEMNELAPQINTALPAFREKLAAARAKAAEVSQITGDAGTELQKIIDECQLGPDAAGQLYGDLGAALRTAAEQGKADLSQWTQDWNTWREKALKDFKSVSAGRSELEDLVNRYTKTRAAFIRPLGGVIENSPEEIDVGSAVNVKLQKGATVNGDWVAVVPKGSPQNYGGGLPYAYVEKDGVSIMPNLPPGDYEIRVYAGSDYSNLLQSVPLKIKYPAIANATSPADSQRIAQFTATVKVGEPVSVQVKGEGATDWIAITPTDAPAQFERGQYPYSYLSSGRVDLTPLSAGQPLTAGNYELRVYKDNGYEIIERFPVVVEAK